MDNKKKLSGQELIDAIINFNNDSKVQKLASFYSNQSVPEIFGVTRREVSHSAFLSWLFNPSANHGLGGKPLMQLLERYLKCCRDQKKVSTDGVQLEQIQSAILTRNISILSTDVQTEEAVAIDKAKGRADIVIACNVHIPDNLVKKISIIIENKIYSEEHKEQTQTYFDYHQSKKLKDEEVCLYIYLTPPANKDAKCSAFVHLTYQDLLDHILEPLLIQSNVSDRTKFILTEYINNLSIPSDYIDETNTTKKARTIMAISTKERELLDSFWNQHINLFITALTAMSTDENAGEEERIEAKDVLDKIQHLEGKRDKDNSKYSIDGDGAHCKRQLPFEVIKKYISNNKGVTYGGLKELFPDKLQGAWGVIKTEEEITSDTTRKEPRKKYLKNPIEHNDLKLCICGEWGIVNINKFIDHVNATENIGIKIKKVE